PEQVGAKAMEANVSDIAAMGGIPTYGFVSISLTDKIDVETVEGIYNGMYSVCDKYGCKIIGGDTTHGGVAVINIALLGLVEKRRLCLRSQAEVGDLIVVTGDLGKSKAGLELLLKEINDKKELLQAHLEPKCRINESRKISKYANAMIDVSDGLASEVNHICERSGVGAVVKKDEIPVSDTTKKAASLVRGDPIDYALNGGEDFELVFTIPEEKFDKIKVDCPLTVVGKIVGEEKGVSLSDKKGDCPLGGGFDHFKKA
ncbi:thiamine-phosphate kinase, partial [Candidatus Altiarchaeota archaeon]